MTNDILLTIKGMQFTGETEEEQLEVVTSGRYFAKDGKHYIKYDEVMEGTVVSNLVKINDNGMEVTKRGKMTNVHMVFEENKKNMTYYDTPFGNLLIGIAATSINVNTQQDQINVQVDYALEINYEYLVDCTIQMNIISKNNRQAQLL